MTNSWHSFSLEKTFEKLESSERGLSLDITNERLKRYGANILPEEKPHSKWRPFLSQFQSPRIYILLAVLLFNAIVGVIQEGKAQNTLLALKKFVETNATVLRAGKEFIIPDRE